MRVISRTRLREFWDQPAHRDAEGPLRAWYTLVSNRTINWHAWSDVKTVFASASLVGNCVVFNIGGNKYRLVTRILYPSQKVFVLKVLSHKEYDRAQWKDECGCFEPPTKRTARQRKPVETDAPQDQQR